MEFNCEGIDFMTGAMFTSRTKKVEYRPAKEVFDELYSINVNEKLDTRNKLTYLPWADAFAEMEKHFPDMEYGIIWFDGKPYWHDENLGYIVFTFVTVEGQTKLMWLPCLDSNNKVLYDYEYSYDTKYNKDIKVEPFNVYAWNKSIMRCLVKNFAAFGLGVYVYAKEDLPEPEADDIRAAEELENAKKEIKELGNKFIASGGTKNNLLEIIGKHNNGNDNPADIETKEICDAIIADLKKLKPKKTTKSKEEK